MNDFQNEWAIIHNNIESYQRLSLIIKLFSILIFTLSLSLSIDILATSLILLILWLQDAIWTTFQKRLETRIFFIEEKIKENNNEDNTAFLLYSEWQNNRLGSLHLIKEYLLNAVKPTVAYPYSVLVFALYFLNFIN